MRTLSDESQKFTIGTAKRSFLEETIYSRTMGCEQRTSERGTLGESTERVTTQQTQTYPQHSIGTAAITLPVATVMIGPLICHKRYAILNRVYSAQEPVAQSDKEIFLACTRTRPTGCRWLEIHKESFGRPVANASTHAQHSAGYSMVDSTKVVVRWKRSRYEGRQMKFTHSGSLR